MRKLQFLPAWALGGVTALASFAPLATAAVAPQDRAAVFLDNLPSFPPDLAREAAAQAQAAGYRVEFIGTAALTNQDQLSATNYDLLVLPGARWLPAVAAPAIEHFLKQGGDLLALGLPAWEAPVFQVGGQWLTRERYEQALAAQKSQRVIEDFERGDLSKWAPSSNEPKPAARYELADGDRGKALHTVMGKMIGWETFASPVWSQPFPTDHTLTCLRAKGGPNTKQLALEWTEQDGSRWIATVDLGPQWQDYALPPEAFKPWQPPAGRGGPGDRLNPRNAARFVVGLALSHTGQADGPQEYWFDDLGTAPNPFGDALLPESRIPRLESLSPGYQFFPMSVGQASRLSVEWEVLPSGSDRSRTMHLTLPPEAGGTPALRYGFHPRPRGIGYDQRRPWRWQPLLAARAGEGDYRGAVGLLLVHSAAPFRGGIWAGFTPAAPEFYRQPEIRRLLREVLGCLKRGLFLLEGGSEFFTVFEHQPLRLGARVVNFGKAAQTNAAVRLKVVSARNGQAVFTHAWPLDLAAGADAIAEQTWSLQVWPEGGCRVVTELTLGGRVIDRLEHELHVWRPQPQPEFIAARDGGLWLGAKPWKAHGVNYMPSTGIGVAAGHFFEHWVGRGSYDPEVIERDLRRVRAMNLNAVSAFIYHESLPAQHLLDFLRRCEALDLKVNLSLRPGTPMDFRWNEMKALIEFYRLAQNDTVFTYDLAWEPSHFDHAYQETHYTAAWGDWVLQRHGSLEAALTTWELNGPTAPEHLKSQISNRKSLSVSPSDWLTRDGPWRKCVADYRRFLDDLLREKYGEARRLVRSIDPHHPVSFRMTVAGDPTYNWDAALAYDFYGLADAVDLWEPEAYGRIGDWDRVKAGRFTAAYARLCDPKKPLIWAEMGNSVWDMKAMAPDPARLKFTARYYADFYRMMIESGADGVFFWWYPGGFRLNENSDYGIINPDGTDREITRVIRTEGARFLAAPKPPAPERWLTVDRDRDARGLFGLYEAAKDEFWKAVAEGKEPGLKWSKKPGGAQPQPD